MDTQNYILNKFNIHIGPERVRMPIEIPNIGRDNLPALFKELGFKNGVEIGVRGGEYSVLLSEAGMQVYGVDPYTSYHGYWDHTRQGTFDAFEAQAIERLKPYADYRFVRKFSLDAVKDFADGSLDFVYIDGNHNFQNCTNDIIEWTKKVRIGGIIAGHDYVKHKKPTHMHVVEVVQAYTDAYDIKPWFLLGTKEVVEGQIRDKERSFMWVNLPIARPGRNSQ